MGKKKDLKQIDDIAKKYNMTKEQRKEFGKFIENEKKKGRIGSENERGDYTWEELKQKGLEFLAKTNKNEDHNI